MIQISRATNFIEIGRRLKLIRGDLSQTAFGEPIGYRYEYVKNIEHGAKPSLEFLLKVAEHYHISLDWLLRGIESISSANNFSPYFHKKPAVYFDPDLIQMVDVLTNLMQSSDPNLRGWAIIQFRRAFADYCNVNEEK